MMNNMHKWVFSGIVSVFLASTTAIAAPPKSEADLIADLSSSKTKLVIKALTSLEKQFPTSTNSFAEMRKLLADDRVEVRRKSARVLGILHADVSEADLKNITAMLKSSNPAEVIDALKSLRGLEAESTIPDIVALLDHKTPNVIRDACRTLAVLGDKDLIPQIEPLLTREDERVQRDAKDAIFKLSAK